MGLVVEKWCRRIGRLYLVKCFKGGFVNWSRYYPVFKKEEFDCQETGENDMQEQFLDRLYMLRNMYDKPMVITSGYRSPNHSLEKSKPKPGTHTKGIAADVRVYGQDKYELARLAFELGFTGIGISNSFIHLDISDERKAIWSY